MLQTQMMPFEPLIEANQSRDDYFLSTSDASFLETPSYNSYFPVYDHSISVASSEQQQLSAEQHPASEESWQKLYHVHQSKPWKVDVIQSAPPPPSSSSAASATSSSSSPAATCDASRKAVLLQDLVANSDNGTLEQQEVEDVDDDEFLEEEYAEAYRELMIPDSPTRLVHFIGKVTVDIRDHFARNKGQEDYCDVYEERFKTTLSGRELYYADLLALASNSETIRLEKQRRKFKNRSDPKNSDDHRPTSRLTNENGRQCTVTCRNTHTPIPCGLPHRGHEMKSVGLGPFEELFVVGPPHENSLNKLRHSNFSEMEEGSGGGGGSSNEDFHVRNPQTWVPMAMRKLPQSFWKQPALHDIRRNCFFSNVGRTPDFSDLYEHWTGKH